MKADPSPEELAAWTIKAKMNELNALVRDAITNHNMIVSFDTLSHHEMVGRAAVPILTASIAKEF